MSYGVSTHKSIPWWMIPRREGCNEELANAVCATVQDIERRQHSIHEGHRRHARIYAGYLPQGLGWGVSATSNARTPFEATKAVVRSVCDSATALIVRSRPKSTFVTDGADWDTQLLAEDLDQFTQAQYQTGGLYEVAPRSFHDTTVFGTGGWKYVPSGTGENFKLNYERFLIDDLVVDEDECRDHLQPENMYHRTMVRRDAVLKRYCSGDTTDARDRHNRVSASQDVGNWPSRYVPAGRMVLVEATHIGDGVHRRVLCCQGVVLKDTVWPFDFHPYTTLWWSMPLSGWYGDGIAYRQYGRQQRITYMYRWIQRVHDLMATPRAWVDPAGGPPTMQMSNEIGQVIMARRPPVFETKQYLVHPEIYRWLDELERGGYEDEGISQVSAQNMLPPGLESAPAQREYSFKEGQRFAPVSQRWEHAIAVDTAYKTIAFFKHNAERTQKRPKVAWANRTLVQQIEWPDLKDQVFVIRPEASSLDALSPSARTQAALELAQTGWISPQEGRALVAHPDLREADELATSGEMYAKMVLKELRKGIHVPVDEYADLLALDRVVRQGRALAVIRKAPQKVIDNMSRYLDELDVLKQQMQAAAMQQQAMMAGPAGAPAGEGAPPTPALAQASINNPVPAPFQAG